MRGGELEMAMTHVGSTAFATCDKLCATESKRFQLNSPAEKRCAACDLRAGFLSGVGQAGGRPLGSRGSCGGLGSVPLGLFGDGEALQYRNAQMRRAPKVRERPAAPFLLQGPRALGLRLGELRGAGHGLRALQS